MKAAFGHLETIHINQDLQLNQLRVKPNSQMAELADMPETALIEYLGEFSRKFRFQNRP